MNKKYTGINCLVKVLTIDAQGEKKTLAGQRDATLNIEYNEVDVTSKDSTGGWEEVIAGQRSWNISCSGAHVAQDATMDMVDELLLTAKHTPENGMLQVDCVMEHDTVYSGRVLVTSFSKNMPMADLVTYDMSLRGTGPLVKTAAVTGTQAVVPTGTQVVAQANAETKGAK